MNGPEAADLEALRARVRELEDLVADFRRRASTAEASAHALSETLAACDDARRQTLEALARATAELARQRTQVVSSPSDAGRPPGLPS